MTNLAAKEFDLVVFGASGFTGQFVVEEVATVAIGTHLKWAIAGRSRDKLYTVLQTASNVCGHNLQAVPTIVADVKDALSLVQMCKTAKVLINCVGPYRFHGEAVVAACIAGKAHHIDISAEPQFLESVQLKYHETAKEAGVYLIGACGWDSIPTDMGITFLKKHFIGDLNSVETFISYTTGPGGPTFHYGTWQAAMYGFGFEYELKDIRKKLKEEQFEKPFPRSFKYPLKLRRTLSLRSDDWPRGWCLPFPGSDKSIVYRTQRYNYEHFNERPVQVETYFLVVSLLNALVIALVGGLFQNMAVYTIGRYLLEKFPKFFSAGMFSHEGPSRKELEHAAFTTYLVGKGWKEKLPQPTDQHSEPPNKTVKMVVRGPDAGYKATAIFVVQSALVVLQESQRMPGEGGVLTTGSAFGNTTLIDRLKERGIQFTLFD